MKILTKEEEQAHYKYPPFKLTLPPRSLLTITVRRSRAVLLVVPLDWLWALEVSSQPPHDTLLFDN